MRKLFVILFCVQSLILSSATYYVAPTGGNNSYAGTISQPWATWQKAFETAVAGDTVYFRGGVWYPTTAAYGNNITQISPPSVGHNGEPGRNRASINNNKPMVSTNGVILKL